MPGISSEQFDDSHNTTSFQAVERLVNMQFENAIAKTHNGGDLSYFTIGERHDAIHKLGFISLAEGVESLRRRKVEILELAVPLDRADVNSPLSVLGTFPDADYFFLTYMAERGGEKTLRLDQSTYERRFLGKGKPPVRDFIEKLGFLYQVIPMRETADDTDS